jgi:hypothetical protein
VIDHAKVDERMKAGIVVLAAYLIAHILAIGICLWHL